MRIKWAWRMPGCLNLSLILRVAAQRDRFVRPARGKFDRRPMRPGIRDALPDVPLSGQPAFERAGSAKGLANPGKAERFALP